MDEKMRYILKLLIIVLLNVCVIGIIGRTLSLSQDGGSVSALSRAGSRGDEVRAVQEKLLNLGYDIGEPNGLFDARTVAAVKAFQADNGLTIDGVAGTPTLRALGIGRSGADTAGFDSDYDLLARLISAESKGEPYTGQVAVGAVVLNRVQHPSFPDSITGVAYQPGAFASVTDGRLDKQAGQSAYRAAREALNGADPSGGAVYYYSPAESADEWMASRPVTKIIGTHRFCK